MDTSSIQEMKIDRRTKGFPGTAEPTLLKDICEHRWNVLREDMPLPLMVLKRSNLNHNSEIFSQYLASYDLSLAPHGKTTMSPQLFEEQIQQGAWGLTAATIGQMQVMRHYGADRVILANQLVGKSNIQTGIVELNADPDFEFFCFIDSVEQMQNIECNLDGLNQKRPINVLVEIGAIGGRTGVRSKDAALFLIEKIIERPGKLKFCGIGAFEGAIPGLDGDGQAVTEYAELILDIIRDIPQSAYKGLGEFILTGGGSAYFDIIAERFKSLQLSIPVRVLLRSGCYITNDQGAYFKEQEKARLDTSRDWQYKLRPALEIWSYVQSIPEPELAFLTMGKRDVPFDAGLPIPFKRYRPGVGFLDIGQCEIYNTNDQHAYVRLGPGTEWVVGDMICSGISHPCTAFDKWRFIPVVNDDYDVIEAIMTYF